MVDAISPLLSGIFAVLFERISRRELLTYFRNNHLDVELIEKLKLLLVSTNTMLSDAAHENLFLDPLLNDWVAGLRRAAYNVVEILDDIAMKPVEELARGPPGALDQIVAYVSEHNPFADQLQSRVNGAIDRLESILKHKDLYLLKIGATGSGSATTGSATTASSATARPFASTTTSLVDEGAVFGRNADKDKILEFLLSDNNSSSTLQVAAILGMGGVGKTTLAQILYNDERVKTHFKSRSWTCVSESSSIAEVTKSVFESFTQSPSNVSDLNVLQSKLTYMLAGKRFLIVLDGYWNGNYLDWDVLRLPFLSGQRGSTIIITTSSQSVAVAIRADLIHSVSVLTPEDAWKLFTYHAFTSGNQDDEHPFMTQIGQNIVNSCNGLPLAIKTLGSLLRSKDDIAEWEDISTRRIWELPTDQTNILRTLRLSFSHIPRHLRDCFTYCSIFPKDHKINKWDLIYLWMAEGILPPSKMGRRMEDVGERCFQELLSWSVFQQSSQDTYTMHSVINNLAECDAGEFYSKLEHNHPSDITSTSNVHHLSYLQGIHDTEAHFQIFYELHHLRTFLPFKFLKVHDAEEITSMVAKLLEELKCLRVLSLSHYPILTLPVSIENSTHLRYLNLSYTGLDHLPDIICHLYNLETLLLLGCQHLTELPTNLSNLVKLRHLDINGTRVEGMPARFSKLKSLQTLTSFVISNVDWESKISELGDLSELRGALIIQNVQNIADEREASNARLWSKKYIHNLEFKWKDASCNVQSQTNVLNGLEPPHDVKTLSILNFGGHAFPNWMGSSSFSSMIFLHIDGCHNCLSLPSLGQLPSLKELIVQNMAKVKEVDLEFHGNVDDTFKSLKVMKFQNMPNWEKWSSKRFPALQELHINNCPKLSELASELPSLEKLLINECVALTDPMPLFPSLRELQLRGCHGLTSLLSPEMMQGNQSLQKMVIRDCSCLLSISMNGLPTMLASLQVYGCKNVQLFYSQNLQEPLSYPALEVLWLTSSCDSIISFQLSDFPNLKDLRVQDCNNLKSITCPSIHQSLKKLELMMCSELTELPQGGLPTPQLESLVINKCAYLPSEPLCGSQGLESLTSLHLKELPNLRLPQLSGIQNLPSLKSLKIEDCVQLYSLPNLEASHSNAYPVLEKLQLKNCCNSMTAFPLSAFPKLKDLHVQAWKDLKEITLGRRIPKYLKKLKLKKCSKLSQFPQAGFAPQLEALSISKCTNLLQETAWGLGSMKSLTSLHIKEIPRLTTLESTGIQHLSSLKNLKIKSCPNLESLCLDRLVPNLFHLTIRRSPLLTSLCEKDTGEYWNMVKLIPSRNIED